MTNLLGDQNTMIASFFWGTVGFGFFIFGKKQGSVLPLFGGVFLMGFSYFITSALNMSLASIAVIAAIFFLKGRF